MHIDNYLYQIPAQRRKRWHVRQRNVSDLDIFVAPLVEQLDAANFRLDILGQDRVEPRGVFDLDFAVVGHDERRIHLLSTRRIREGAVGVER